MQTVQAPRSRAHYPGFSATLKLVGTGPRGSRDLTFEEARHALAALLAAEVTPAQAGAFLIATRIKGESSEELAGYAQALREVAVPLHARTSRPLVACAGGYDGVAQAPNLSLAAALVAGACGAGVVLHCGGSVGPKHGTTALQVLAALGGPSAPTPAQSQAMLERAGVTVLDTAQALTGWAELLVLRNEIGLRGPVHSAEKLIDYCGARRFVIGHTHAPYAARLLGALELLGAERALVVRGIEGSDVARPGRPVVQGLDGPIALPERLGCTVSGEGGAERSAAVTREVLDGRGREAERDAILLSAAIRLYAAGLVPDVRDGLDLADGAIRDGAARGTLAAMVASA